MARPLVTLRTEHAPRRPTVPRLRELYLAPIVLGEMGVFRAEIATDAVFQIWSFRDAANYKTEITALSAFEDHLFRFWLRITYEKLLTESRFQNYPLLTQLFNRLVSSSLLVYCIHSHAERISIAQRSRNTGNTSEITRNSRCKLCSCGAAQKAALYDLSAAVQNNSTHCVPSNSVACRTHDRAMMEAARRQ